MTHIVLGACIGEAIAGKTLGKKALLFGAAAQTIPDIDVFSSLWMEPDENLLVHRGFTHSIFFSIIIAGFLSLLMKQLYHNKSIPLRIWILLLGINIFTHIFIDTFNAYGTCLLLPFDNSRISFNALFVADPLFTITPLAAFVVLLYLHRNNTRRKYWWQAGIGISCLYLLYAIVNKININADVEHNLSIRDIKSNKFITTPTPLNSWLWYVIVPDSSGFYIGYRSVFDTNENIDLNYFPRRDTLISLVQNRKEMQHLIQFSQGFYTLERWTDTLVFNDLRFGQIIGWHDPNEKFVFHYHLSHSKQNKLIVQRARFAKWNKETVKSFWLRIKGK